MSDYATLREQLGAAYELLSQYVPPEVEDVPMVTGTGSVSSVLTCTMGNWKYMGQGGTYSYAWSAAGSADANTYTVAPTDAGTSITCTVTATNANGSTAAPPSNAIAIPGAVVESAPQRARAEHEEEPHRGRGRHEEEPHRGRR